MVRGLQDHQPLVLEHVSVELNLSVLDRRDELPRSRSDTQLQGSRHTF